MEIYRLTLEFFSRDESMLEKYGLKANDAILAEEKHMGIYEDLLQNHNAKLIAGGAAQNTARGAQVRSIAFLASLRRLTLHYKDSLTDYLTVHPSSQLHRLHRLRRPRQIRSDTPRTQRRRRSTRRIPNLNHAPNRPLRGRYNRSTPLHGNRPSRRERIQNLPSPVPRDMETRPTSPRLLRWGLPSYRLRPCHPRPRRRSRERG